MNNFLNDSIGFNINITANILRNNFKEFLKPYEIAPEQFATMLMLENKPNITQTEIAKNLFRDKATVTRMLDSLIKKKLILKEKVNSDKRVYRVKLSKKGLEVVKSVKKVVEPIKKAQIDLFSEYELKEFFKVLKKLQEFEFKK